jgi:GT2 family glycosyltransferase
VVSVAVIAFNARDVLRRTLLALRAARGVAQLVVVDSGSSDGAPEMVEDEFPEVRVHRVENRGYVGGVNAALGVLEGERLALMNSDVFVRPETFERLESHLEADPRAGLAGPWCVLPDGRAQSLGPLYRWNHRGWRAVPAAEGGGFVNVAGGAARRVAWISGALMVVTRDCLDQVGPMDEAYGFYNEELDWCFSARKAGFHVLLAPEPVVHVGGASTPSGPAFVEEGYRGGLYFAYKHYPRWVAEAYRLGVIGEAWLRRQGAPASLRPGYDAAIRRALARRLER